MLRLVRRWSALALLAPLTLVMGASASAQAIVGYGALTGASSVGASAGKAAGESTRRTMRRVGGSLSRAADAPSDGRAVKVRTAEGVVRLGFDDDDSSEDSIVVFTKWSGAEDAAAEPPVAVASLPADAPVTDTVTASASSPESLKRGGDIEDVIAEFGRPSLVINGSGTAGYDRKYVFRGPDGRRHAVLVLGGRVVNWSSEQ